jgi:hypothetical protein
MFGDGFRMKKSDRIRPWMTPMKINIEMMLKWVEVFIYQM